VANSVDLRRLALASVPGTPIDVILNGTDVPDEIARPRETRSNVRVLAISRLIPRKGLDTLIKALQQTPRELLSLDIAGEGPDAEQLQELARSAGVADRVRFNGFVNRAELALLHRNADIFVLASRAESCSMALLEAMAAGLPLVATNVGGNSEIIKHGDNGLLFRAGNAEDLAAALSTLAANPAMRQRFGATNRVQARTRFSWRAVAKRYEAIFLQATGQHGSIDRHEPAPEKLPILWGGLAHK
jgi:glycosyltransferase involved in cell wall biosynthesis